MENLRVKKKDRESCTYWNKRHKTDHETSRLNVISRSRRLEDDYNTFQDLHYNQPLTVNGNGHLSPSSLKPFAISSPFFRLWTVNKIFWSYSSCYMSDFWLLISFLGNSSYWNFPLNYVLNIYSNKGDVNAIVVVFIAASCCDCYSSQCKTKS